MGSGMDSLSQKEGFWEVVGQVVSSFDLFRTLPLGGGLLVPCSLPGPPVVKQLMQMVTMVPGQGGRFQSVASPNKTIPTPWSLEKLFPRNWSLVPKKPGTAGIIY